MRWALPLRCPIYIFLLLVAASVPLEAQTHSTTSNPPAVQPSNEPDSSFDVAEDLLALDGPELPQRGFNASAGFNGLHDSQLGWAGFVQPAISYRFNRRYSADATIPIYFYRNGFKYNPLDIAKEKLSSQMGELGDTTIAGHAQFSPGRLDYTATAAMNAPTGDKTYGLSTGRVTYVLMNDFETVLDAFTPQIQLGFGDNSDLVNRKVQRNYDTLGSLAYFQAGGAYTLPRNWNVESDAYEQLPIGNQKLYTNVTIRKKRILIPTNGSAEDNGVTVYLYAPSTAHFQFSSYYNRSFRLADDTVGVTLTFALKTPKAILPLIP